MIFSDVDDDFDQPEAKPQKKYVVNSGYAAYLN